MTSAEKILLSDAIETAIRSERKVIIQRRMIIALLVINAVILWIDHF